MSTVISESVASFRRLGTSRIFQTFLCRLARLLEAAVCLKACHFVQRIWSAYIVMSPSTERESWSTFDIVVRFSLCATRASEQYCYDRHTIAVLGKLSTQWQCTLPYPRTPLRPVTTRRTTQDRRTTPSANKLQTTSTPRDAEVICPYATYPNIIMPYLPETARFFKKHYAIRRHFRDHLRIREKTYCRHQLRLYADAVNILGESIILWRKT